MRIVMDVVEGRRRMCVREWVRRARCHVLVEERAGSKSRWCTAARLCAAGAC